MRICSTSSPKSTNGADCISSNTWQMSRVARRPPILSASGTAIVSFGLQSRVDGYVGSIVAIVTACAVVQLGKAEVERAELKRATVEHLADVVGLVFEIIKKTAKQ